jgi:hypothetical protein
MRFFLEAKVWKMPLMAGTHAGLGEPAVSRFPAVSYAGREMLISVIPKSNNFGLIHRNQPKQLSYAQILS